jgi:ABC-type nitrate/sulfonate/bicarbonate transport system substrate-binding protein
MAKLMAVAAALATLALGHAAAAADTLVLQLGGPAEFRFAGYYAALWQGYYRAAGLDIVIRPGVGAGGKPIDPVREVSEGRAQFGTGTAELVVRAAQGLPITLLAPIFQRSGAMVYYRAADDYASPGALAKARLGRLPASDILDIELATALKAEGIDPNKLDSVPLQRGAAAAALAGHVVDAAPGSAWEVPWRAYEKGIGLKSFNPADYRVEFYGDTLFTLRRRVERQPETVRRFRAASLKGWAYALQHPDAVEKRLVADLPHPPGVTDAAGFAQYQAKLARRLARYPEVALGHSNPDRWARIETAMSGVGALLRTADSDEFVYDPDAAARRANDLRSFAILGGTLVAGLAVLLVLWHRRRRRPRPAAAAETTAAAGEPAAAAPAPPAETPAAPALTAPAPAAADLNPVVGRLERAMRQRLPRQAAFRLSLLPELWRCRAEPRLVRRLLLDLVAGAAADLDGTGEIVVGTRNFAFDAAAAAAPGAGLGEFVRITVRDSGPGLSEEALDRVFDAAASRRPSAAAAARAMTAAGGFVRVESAEGVGTAIHLYFPRAAEAAKPKQAEAAE